ncbi:hypothetical protein PR048_012839 [Dryococelus australis]|uniref:Uncharacterized protein n=1 Tax=Dryococelus australis TaxID=614101 RepID=A0ABQ9HQW9_9NEOP|nr:hypothetical protein PR048_012839 [Dryococelus australis]
MMWAFWYIKSPKMRSRFEENIKEKEYVKISIPQILCPTRWCVHTAALDTMLQAYPHTLELLGEIILGTKGIAICCRVCGPSERLSVTLQRTSMTCSLAAKSIEVTNAHFLKCRID